MSKRLKTRMKRTFKRLVNTGGYNSNTVIMRWDKVTAVAGHDPYIESSPENTREEQSENLKAMVHIGNYERTGYSRFEEIAAGDIIVDFPHDVDLAGSDDPAGVTRENVRFEFQGKIYTQKGAGKDVRNSADVVMGNEEFCITLLLELAE